MDSNLLLGQLLALVTAACWAQNSIIYRHLGKQVGSDAVAHIRMWLALPAIILLTYLMEGMWFPLHLSPQTYFFILASGAIGYFVTDKLLFQAYILLGSRESMVIMTLSPVVTAIFGFFLFAERLNGIQVLGILTTILGVLLMVLLDRKPVLAQQEQKDRSTGLLFAILASVLQSVSFLMAKFAMDETGPVATNLLRNIGGLSIFIIYNFFFKKNGKKHLALLKKPRLFLILLFAALAGPVLGMTTQMKAFTLAPVGIVTTITQITPILLLPFDRFILHKKLSLPSLGGTFLSIAGVAVLFLAA
ncbi:MAG: DMT family transporter [Sphaerochaetaceae bacterium]|nr:DMT family transporter [uncultured Sphaerochaeta sp.]MDC7230128.1 DMT family transporter [Sphaerochaetaceae bacterium]